MLKIGVNHPFDNGSFKEQFSMNGFTLVTIHKHDLRNELTRVDGIVLYALEGHEGIYEWIVEIRKYSAIPIWVCVPTKKIKVQSLLYLHLGVEGVFESEDLDELLLIIKRVVVGQQPLLSAETHRTKIELLPEKLVIKVDNTETELTKLEYQLLSTLLTNQKEVCSYDLLIDSVWADKKDTGTKAQLANLVANLRIKLKPYQDKLAIKTIRTKGYSMKV